MAYYRNEPFGHDYERTAMLCQQIDRLIQVIAIANGAKPKDCPVRAIGDFMPPSWVGGESPKPRKANFDAVQSAVQALFPTADKR